MSKDDYRLATLSEAAKKELEALTLRQRRIVLQGLQRKLWHFKRTKHLSYKYEVCPVCEDLGSTPEIQNCKQCYIYAACQYPFVAGF